MTESRLHIAIDARELCGHPTGVGRYLASLIAEWTRSAAPHRFTLYATEALAWPDTPATEGGLSRPVVDIRVLPGKPGTWWEQMQLPAALAADRPDVLFAPAYTAPLRTRVPVVLTIHDLSFVAHPEWFSWREGLRRRWVTRQAARRAAAVIAVSEFSRQEILNRFGLPAARVHTIHSGLPRVAESDSAAMGAGPSATGEKRLSDRAALAKEQAAVGAERLVLYAGSIFNRRHVPDLVRAFTQVVARHASARLVLVGDNRTHPHESIEALVGALGLSGHVELRAYVSDADLSALYRQARVFAFLSEYEGFGFTPLEALQARVPILVADTAVSREIYGEAATYVPVGDVSACAHALLRLLEDDEARGRVLAEAPAVLARYSWERAAMETLGVLESVVMSGVRGPESGVHSGSPKSGVHAGGPKSDVRGPGNLELTIVIVSYNAASDLQRCLQSLQDAPPAASHEIIVVDNASTDSSVEVARGWPDVRVIEAGGNLGFARANNLGIRESDGELVLLLNSDTIVAPGAIDRLVADLRVHPEAAVAGPRIVDGGGRTELSFGRMIGPFNELRQKVLVRLHARGLWPVAGVVERMTRREQTPDWVSGACLLVRRADAEAAGLLDEQYFLYAEDVDFCAAIRARGRGIRFVPSAEIVHLRGRSGASAPRATERAYRQSQIRFYEKHHPAWAPWLRAYLRVRGRLPR